MKFFKIAMLVAVLVYSTQGSSFDLTSMALHAAGNHLLKANNSSPPEAAVVMPRSTGNFGECRQNFANGNAPIVPNVGSRAARALCFNGFAVLHSGTTKTPIYSAEVLNKQRIEAAKGGERTNRFFADARLPSSERAELQDYLGANLDRGHNSPSADMDNPESIAQSFSLANMMPQAPENNRKLWAGVEKSTRKYVLRAQGNVYVITGSVSFQGQCPIHLKSNGECMIGNGVVVPSHIYKLVYDATTKRAWAYWTENTNLAIMTAPISYEELVRRTGIEFLPGIHPGA